MVGKVKVNLTVVPARDFSKVIDLQKNFATLNESDSEDFASMIDEMATLIVEYSDIPDVDAVKELPVSEIGLIFGKLSSISNPKA